jgi:hypothetical protein
VEVTLDNREIIRLMHERARKSSKVNAYVTILCLAWLAFLLIAVWW